MRRLNVKLLGILGLAIVFCGVAIHGLHAFQVHRQLGAFLREADRAERANDPQSAADFLRKYLLFVPDDTAVEARLGNLLLDQHRFAEAQTVLSRVVQQDENNEEARRRLVDASLHLQRYLDAEYQLREFLEKAHPNEGDLDLKLGICWKGLGQDRKAALFFASAIEKTPALIDAYERLAHILADRPEFFAEVQQAAAQRQESGFPKALRERLAKAASPPVTLLDDLVKRNPASFEARLARGRFLQAHMSDPLVRAACLDPSRLQSVSAPGKAEVVASSGHSTESAETRKMLDLVYEDAQAAVNLAPSDSQALLFAARVSLAKGLVKEAKEFADRASKANPSNAENYLVLASVDMHEKHPEEAAALLSKGLDATGGAPVLVWALADLRIETKHPDEANKLIERLRAYDWARPIVQYLSARMLIGESKWGEACHQLEAAGSALKIWPEIYKLAQFRQAECYSRLGRDDLAILAYRSALDVDPFWTQARSRLADALSGQGRIDEAVVELRRLQQTPDAARAISLTLIRVAIRRNLSKPPNERDWAPIERELDTTIERQPSADATLVAVELRVAEQEINEARQLLKKAIADHPQAPVFWSALIDLTSQQEAWQESEQLLGRMQRQFGDSVLFRLTKARYLIRHFGASRKNELRALSDPPASYSATDRLTLATGMAQTAMLVQDNEQAERLWQFAMDQDPQNLQIPLELFDVALQTSQLDVMQKALDKVQAIERGGAYTLYGEALRQVILAKTTKDAAHFDQAMSQLEQARAVRPNWSKVALLAAEINDYRGRNQQAVENYLEAIDLGERAPRVVSRALNLIFAQKDYARAELVIRKLRDEKTPYSAEFTRYASTASAETGDYDRALNLARQVAAESKDVRDRIWLATVLQVCGKASEAESELQKATAAFPNDVPPWVALIQFYATTGNRNLAQKTVEQFRQNTAKMDPNQAKPALAYAYQLAGDMRQAEATYDAVLKAKPDDFRTRQLSIELKFKLGEMQEAQSQLRGLIAVADPSKKSRSLAWARRTLALSLAAAPTFPKYREARELIEKNLSDSPSSDVDLRAAAIIDAGYPSRAAQDRALGVLTQLEARGKVLTHDDRIVLARLLSRQSWVQSSQIFRDVVTQSKDPRHIGAYVDALLDHSELDEADVWLRRLEEMLPNDVGVTDLRARLLARQGRYDQAYDYIVDAANKGSNDPAIRIAKRRLASARLEQLGDELVRQKHDDQARRFFNSAEAYLGDADSGPPKPSLVHLRFLLRRQLNARAVEEFDRLCEHGSSADVDAACMACASMTTGDIELLGRLERSIAGLAQRQPTASVWMSLAAVQDQMRRYDDEMASYREVLKFDPKRVEALNNLAYILVLRKKDLAEARSLVNRAIEEAGPQASILDSRALVEMASGQPDAALADWDTAVGELPTGTHLFHQALARWRSGRVNAARDAFNKAVAQGLTVATVHPLEVAAFRDLKAQLEPPAR